MVKPTEHDLLEYENNMETLTHRALHYVHCYHSHFKDSGALDVAIDLLELLQLKLEGHKTRDAQPQLERIPDIQGGEEDSNNDFFLDGFDDQIIGDSH